MDILFVFKILLVAVVSLALLWLALRLVRWWTDHQFRLSELKTEAAIRQFHKEKAAAIPTALDHGASVTASADGTLVITQHWYAVPRVEVNARGQETENEPPRLSQPARSIYYARELYESGQLLEAIHNGRILLGKGDVRAETGIRPLLGIPRKKYFSTIGGGIPSSGKTTTAYWILVQQLLIGARLVLIDPHMHYESEDGERSLSAELAPFRASFVFPPCDASSPGAIMQRVKWMKSQVDARKRPGYIARASDIVIGVFDEFNSVIELDEIRTELAADLAYIEREGRKYGVHMVLLGHRWSQQDIGKVSLRTVASTIMAHKQNDEGQAAALVGRGPATKQVMALQPGSYLFRSINPLTDDDGEQVYDLVRVQTPMISAEDAPWVLALQRQIVAEFAEGASVPSSTPTSDQLPTSFPISQWEAGTDSMNEPGNVVEGTLAENHSPVILSLMHKVLEYEARGVRNQEELIEKVWGPEYTTGRKRQDVAIPQLMQVRKAIAEQLKKYGSIV